MIKVTHGLHRSQFLQLLVRRALALLHRVETQLHILVIHANYELLIREILRFNNRLLSQQIISTF